MTLDATTDCPSQPEYDWEGYAFDTRQVHAGEYDDLTSGARISPINMTAGFRFDSFTDAKARFAGEADGLIYSRQRNPSGGVAERKIASLEGGTEAIVVASGQAAITAALLSIAQSGDHIVSTASIYSGTRILFGRSFARFGVTVDYVWDEFDDDEWDRVIRPNTKAIFSETIPNPKNDIVDIGRVAAVAQRHGIPFVVDNTIASPFLIRPFEHGADVVVHSSTKFLSGHGAAISGTIVDGGSFDWAAADREYPLITQSAAGLPSIAEKFGRTAYARATREAVVNDIGPALSPFNSFLLHQGIETLSLRMERHLSNSLAIAAWLAEHPGVQSVDYAGLPGNPAFDLAQRLYGGRSGSVFSFTVRGGEAGAGRFLDRLRVISHMTNIGDTRSMALHPATSTHASFSQELRERLGIGPGLIRLSVGIEAVADLIADLDRALS
ncbi:O-acetylhomoserine aminocarboxypropyltransferase/cysteine synthase family protein [Cryobacterium sp. TMB1-7]|uniref:O-acetylhomoserine aminocarboxypropyltransferase/cysteine synthase family protein n=1 Tax=Cryobacterium sp. TMB1-7 TaxID=2555866 RepID=UPI0010690E6D|nr:PLP-dependent transferase [Cryobacterium sp. TMB1-7]TFC58932.1 O-acetylhomoserine aminocarboxypropyltransferase/cysteine synthase [Cryobacterium sp. TMB1-7]